MCGHVATHAALLSMNIMTYFSCSGGLILGLPVDIEKIMLTFIVYLNALLNKMLHRGCEFERDN